MSMKRYDQDSTVEHASAQEQSRLNVAVVLAWSVSLAILLLGLIAYGQTPGALNEPPQGASFNHELDTTRYTLMVAVHPRCPCTAASLHELDRIIRQSQDRLHVTMLVYRPANQIDEWTVPKAIDNMEQHDNVIWKWDEEGKAAQAIGCMTSGSVVLYSPDRKPLFWGGITSSRGHTGNNAGSQAILSILETGTVRLRTNPVYGCSLVTPDVSQGNSDGASYNE